MRISRAMSPLLTVLSLAALLACDPAEGDKGGTAAPIFGEPCEGATIDAGIVGETLSTLCDEGESLCWSKYGPDALAIYTTSPADPSELPGQVEVTGTPLLRFGSEGSFAVELAAGTYYVCRYLGDNVADCTGAIVLSAEQPIARAEYTWDGGVTSWTSVGYCP